MPTSFEAKTKFLRKTGVCKHCGQHEKEHRPKGGLHELDIRNNFIPAGQQLAIKALCKAKGVELKCSEQVDTGGSHVLSS
jgi:hypothetical protein